MVLYPLPADTAILLRADGTDWHSNCVIYSFTPPYTRRYPQVVDFQNNSRGFTAFGDAQERIDSLTIEAWSDTTARQIKENIGHEATLGIFTLKVPNLSSASSVDWYLIRFFECEFSPDSVRRRGNPHVQVAEISDIEVLEHTTT